MDANEGENKCIPLATISVNQRFPFVVSTIRELPYRILILFILSK